MDSTLFSQINTTIAVKENSLLTEEFFQKLLQAEDREVLALLLQSTPYPLSAEDLEDLDAIEQVLIKTLAAEYQWAFEETPDKTIVSMFSLRYVYHNIKVLFKAKASKQDFSQLLLPIGEQPLEALSHLVSTLHSEFFPNFMVEELRDIWSEYEDYRDIRVLEVGTDLAYFKHLKKMAEQFDSSVFSQAVQLMIEFYNVITVKRALDQKKPQSFMLQLLSEDGDLAPKDYITLVENQELTVWFNQVNPDGFKVDLKDYEEKMRQSSITAVDLEYLYDVLQFNLLEQTRFEIQGPLVLARYLLGRELEVKNLRLLLSAICNDLPLEAVKERMRPVYGQ